MPANFHFQAEIDFACLRDTIAIVRQGNLMDNKYILIDHATHLLGGVNAYVAELGESPAIMQTPMDGNEPATIESVANQLEQEVDKAQSQDTPIGAGSALGMNPMIAGLLKMLAKLLLEQLL